jgi:hypothetical protein
MGEGDRLADLVAVFDEALDSAQALDVGVGVLPIAVVSALWHNEAVAPLPREERTFGDADELGDGLDAVSHAG